MPGIGVLTLACLLGIASLSGYGDAARTRSERRAAADPYLILPPGSQPDGNFKSAPKDLGVRDFTLRHIYHRGSHEFPNLHRYLDIPQNTQLFVADDEGLSVQPAELKLSARAQSTKIQRMVDRRQPAIDKLLNHAEVHGTAATLPLGAWTVDEVAGPNTTDKATVLTFARMAANAYVTDPFKGDWQDVKGGFNYTDGFGWEADGLRGYIFADETNKTVVIGLKGTSMAVFDGAETTGNDKLNDNLFGSCCCAQGGQYLWKHACDCMSSSAYTCNSTCLVKALREKSHYYTAARDLYHNVTERYPDATDIWLSGHSLGGVVSTLLGLTYGLPVMTYEAYPDALAASRLGLPAPPGYGIGSHQSRTDVAVHHYGHTADPVFMGTCNGASSPCTFGGYAFEGLCHTGKTCQYDTVNDLGWRVGVGTHRILSVIRDVLEKYDTVPECEEDVECHDCFNWKFFESNGTESSTTSSSTSTSTSTRTRTRTETCKTPGWWGCLDPTTTSSQSSTTTSSSSSSTCKTPGWFGCNDPTTTTTTSSSVTSRSASPAPTVVTTTFTTTRSLKKSSSTCNHPGWFGCNDRTTTSSTIKGASSSRTSKSRPASSSTSTMCTSKEWFGLICVDPSPIDPSSAPSPTNLPTTRRKTCISNHWHGGCKQWASDETAPKADLRI